MKNLDDYEVISIIGSGAFGTCFKVQDKITNKMYAWKGINYDDFDDAKKEQLDSEIGLLQQLKHPNIVQYYDHICNTETKTIFIIMEYCDGGDLQILIQKCRKEQLRFEEKYIWKVLYQIAKALQCCHNKISEGCVLHRDIKPANIFLDKCGNVKLGDFGLARILRHNQNENFAESFVGSPYYMSPEIVRGRKYDKKSDMWAVGCLVYEMCCFRPPFRGNRFDQLSDNISNGQFNAIPDHYSKDLQEIISFMLEVDSDQRPTVEILLRHPVFIRNLNDLKADFPKLLPCDSGSDESVGAKKLLFSPTRSLDTTDYTFNFSNTVDCNESSGRLTGVDTPQLRNELFGSAKRKMFPRTSSYPDLNITAINVDERIYANSIMTSHYPFDLREESHCDPRLLTRDIFEEALRNRLETIRAEEMLLKQRENSLFEKEKQLMEKEKRLIALEKDLEEKKHHVEGMLKRVAFEKRTSANRFPKRRISKTLDESYCTIEPNESLTVPTVAKLDLALMPPPLAAMRGNSKKSVTFISPKKIFKVDGENVSVPQPPSLNSLKQIRNSKNSNDSENKKSNNLHSSVSSKTSTESENSSHKSTGKRRSILSIFGLNNNSQKNKGSNIVKGKEADDKRTALCSSLNNQTFKQTKSVEVLNKINSDEINLVWTKENKKAAFEMLAAMNAADQDTSSKISSATLVSSQRNSHLRKTTRDRGTSLNRSSKLRRSAVYLSPNTSANRIIV